MSPRKSSTSSGKPRALRPRYLGLEVAGEHFPPLSPRAWENLLAERLASGGAPTPRFRLVRSEGRRAIVEVDHLAARRARELLDRAPSATNAAVLASHRTWGTLVGAKVWLRADRSRGGS